MRALFVVAMLAAAGASAEEPCGGISLNDTTVKTGTPLTGVPKEDECLKKIASFLSSRDDVSGVTVELRTKDDDRVAGKALANAKRIAGVLTTAGAKNVSYVVPRSDGLELGVVLTAQLKPAPQPIAVAMSPKGEVSVGNPKRGLKQVSGLTNVLPMDQIETREGRVTVVLPNAGLIYARGGSNLVVERENQLSFLSGSLRVETSDAKVVQFTADKNVISVGPKSALELEAVPGHGWHVAVERGQVELRSEADAAPTIVPPGSGTASSGTSVEPVRALLAAPNLSSEVKAGKIHWSAVPGASSYRVEVSPNAQFGPETELISANGTDSTLSGPSGQVFFRVRAVDGNGLPGLPSKTYSAGR